MPRRENLSFRQRLTQSGKEALDSRAQSLLNRVKMEEDKYIQAKKTELLNLYGQLDQLHDELLPSSRMSLKAGDNVNPEEWVRKRHKLQIEIRTAKIVLAEALKVDKEEFPEEDFRDLDDLLGLNDVSDLDVEEVVLPKKKTAKKPKTEE